MREDSVRIKVRLLLLLIPAIILALGLLCYFGVQSARTQAQRLAFSEAESIALEQSSLTLGKLQQAESAVMAFAAVALQMKEEGDPSRQALSGIAKGVLASSPDFFGAWLLWEPNAFDGRDAEFVGNAELGNAEGRANAYWLREQGGFTYDGSDDYDHEHYYTLPKQKRRLTVIPPYRDMDTKEKVLMTSLAMPLVKGGAVLGVAGIDIELEFLHGIIKGITPHQTGYAMLLSDRGAIIADPRELKEADKGKEVLADGEVVRNIAEGKVFSRTEISIMNGEKVFGFYIPVRMRSFEKPWYFMVALPVDKIMAESRRILALQLGVSCGALVVLVLLVFYTAGGVAAPLQRIAAYAQEVARGNYKAELDPRGFARELQDLRRSLGVMLESLLGSMRESEQRNEEAAREAQRAREAMAEAEKARQASEENHKAMLSVAGRVEAVSRKLQQTSALMTEKLNDAGKETRSQNALMEQTVEAIARMSESTRQVSDNAGDAAEFAERTRERATEGARVVNGTIEAFESIRREAEALGGQINDLGQRTEGIGGILDMINDIADQTNLLALNAAIEAARAGEAGRGFAVVADEVRKLAEKTMQATKQVGEAVGGIRSSMKVSAEGVARTAETVNKTVELGHDAQASLSDIVQLVAGMTDQIRGIAGLCRDQSDISGRVTDVVERLRELSLSVTNAMGEGSAIARDLEPEAKELGLLVERLTKE